MNREDAKVWLQREVPPSAEPATPIDDYNAALDSVVKSANGVEHFDQASLNRAVAIVIGWKVNASAGYFRNGEDAIHKNWLERQKTYSRKASGGGAVAKAADTDSVKALL